MPAWCVAEPKWARVYDEHSTRESVVLEWLVIDVPNESLFSKTILQISGQ